MKGMLSRVGLLELVNELPEPQVVLIQSDRDTALS